MGLVASLSPRAPRRPCEGHVPAPTGDTPDSAAVFPGDLPAEPSKMIASTSHPDLLGGWDAWAEAPAPAPAAEGTARGVTGTPAPRRGGDRSSAPGALWPGLLPLSRVAPCGSCGCSFGLF